VERLHSFKHVAVAKLEEIWTVGLRRTRRLKAGPLLRGVPFLVEKCLASCLLGEARKHLVDRLGIFRRHCEPVARIHIAHEVIAGIVTEPHLALIILSNKCF